MDLEFGSSCSPGSTPTAGPSGEPVDLAWEIDVDSFLDEYLKDVGPEGQDPFGNFTIDVNTLAAFPSVPHLGAAAGAPAATEQCTTEQQQATTLTGEFGATALGSEAATATTRAKSGGQRKASGKAQQASKGEPLDAKSMRKQLALQEKNRRAQRRFRERQKQKVEELTQQVEALSAQLSAVMAEKCSLESRQGMLENVLAMREKQLDAAGQQVDPVEVKPPQSPQQQQQQQQPAAAQAAASDGSNASACTAGGEGDELAVAFQEDLTLSVREGEPTTLTAVQVKGMTPQELATYYKAYVNELAGCLVETSGQPASPERIRCLVDEVCLLCTRVALCNPAGVKHFTLTKVVEDSSAQHADDRVPVMVRALSVSPQQRSQLGQLRRLFLQKLAKIVNDRKEVNAQLLSAIPSGASHRQMAVRYLAAHDAARKLRDNMREEHILVLDFVSTIFKHVLSAQQVAQFMIHSFPYTPDCLALSTWVAAEDGDAEALAMLAAEAQGKQQQAAQQGQAAAAAAGLPSSLTPQQQQQQLPPGSMPPGAMFALPPEQSAAMFAAAAAAGGLPAAMFQPGQMPMLPNGAAIVGNVAVSAAQLMQFGPPAMMQLPSSSFTGPMVTGMPGMAAQLPQLAALPKGACFPPELAAGRLMGAAALPVSPHVVTMSSSR